MTASKSALLFPIPAEKLIPHRPPMQWVLQLDSCLEGRVCATACLPPDAVSAGADGVLHPVTLVELMAQTYAMKSGFEDMVSDRLPKEGYLIGISKAEFTASARVEETLSIRVETIGSFGGFAVAEGEVRAADRSLARASFKVYVPITVSAIDSES